MNKLFSSDTIKTVLEHWPEKVAASAGVATLPPDKKAAVVDKVEAIIRSIASGDRPYLIRQDLLKILKQNI